MKLGIVIPYKAKRLSRNWEVSCRALKNTLRSIHNQTCDDYEVIVVGHDGPDFVEDNENKIHFHTLECAPPDPQSDDFQYSQCIVDKNKKIARGIQLLYNNSITHWFYLDADDLLHREFVKTVLTLEMGAGCILDGGYEYYGDRNRIIPINNLADICGSSSIIASNQFEVPSSIENDGYQKIPFCKYPHSGMDRFFDQHCDGNYSRVHERLVAYNRGHGDNLSDVRWHKSPIQKLKAFAKFHIKGTRVNAKHRRSFSLDQSDVD